jgi:hypothetical protein
LARFVGKEAPLRAKAGLGELYFHEDVEQHREVALKEIQLAHTQDDASHEQV